MTLIYSNKIMWLAKENIESFIECANCKARITGSGPSVAHAHYELQPRVKGWGYDEPNKKAYCPQCAKAEEAETA